MADYLNVDSLSFSYSETKKVLSGIHLASPESQAIGIVGRNGCGKSTLFSCLTTGDYEAGSVFHRGKYIEKRKRSRYFAYLPQQSFLPREVSVSRAVSYFPAEARTAAHDDERIAALLGVRIGSLSGGERRYLEFILVDSLERPFALLDEPFPEIEPLYVQKMIARIRGKAGRKCYLIADHGIDTLKNCCDSLYGMAQGTLIPLRDATDREMKVLEPDQFRSRLRERGR